MGDEREQPEKHEGVVSISADDELVHMAQTIDHAFPNLKCLRCGSESFFLAGPIIYVTQFQKEKQKHDLGHGGFDIKVFDLVCRRCGMIERHAWKILENAAKPIKVD
ncbi:hypothetical protein [Methylosinus sp. Ce-a6]|uniref:hypothetical protein n=1 Tax=Methylosinus sp. Ce-a6 TaxID=2172005 RepID=UPI00135B1820|nr:hypothetical protein [Methylosinus sp. Ce-a6]